MSPRTRDLAGIVSGLALIGAGFLPWFGTPGGTSLTAWQAFSVTDIAIALAAASAIVFAWVSLTRISLSLPVAGAATTAVLALVAAVMIIVRLVDPVGGLERRSGAWLGLLAVGGVLLGAYFGMQEDRAPAPGAAPGQAH